MKIIRLFALSLCIAFSVSNCHSQGNDAAINKIDSDLKSGKKTISAILSDPTLMYLHSRKAFRDVIKTNAKPGHFTMVTKNEPGTKIVIKGTIVDKSNKPVKNVLLYLYHTSDKGWYSDTAAHILTNSGDMNHARLFAYFKTDDKGNFSFETIKPKGYPQSDFAAHIHIYIWDAKGNPIHAPGELQFDDDPRMTPERRKKSLEEGYLISKNSGTATSPVYQFKIITD